MPFLALDPALLYRKEIPGQCHQNVVPIRKVFVR